MSGNRRGDIKSSTGSIERPRSSSAGPDPPAELPVAAIRAQLKKILSSRSFLRSEQLSRFLRFAVEQAIQGRADNLKEYRIGVEVFNRKRSFDPGTDPIVPVEARRLRSKLRAYYKTEGRHDPILIGLSKRGYVPVFRRRAPRIRPGFLSPRERKSIAVLPFANVGSKKENEYLSDGLTEELIRTLTKVRGLRVVSQTSVFRFKGQPRNIREIGKRLSVGAVLEPSLRKQGDRLRITAQLINAADGRYLWSEKYDRKMKDMFAIRDEIARAVVKALRIPLAAKPRRPPVTRYAENLQVYNLYLKGRYFWNQHSPQALKKSVEYFEQAIRKDPNYAPAYAGMADCYLAFGLTGAQSPMEVMPLARAAALQSVEIDGTLAEAHASFGLATALWDCDWPEAERELQRALDLNPGSAVAHQRYAFVLGAMGRLDDSMTEIQRAQELDPLSLIVNTAVGMIFYCRRQYDRAIEEFSNTLELDPNYFLARLELGRAYEQKGAFQEAMAAFEKARSLAGDSPLVLGSVGHFCALSGKRGKAQKLLDKLKALAKQRYVSPTSMALIYIGLGEKDRAFECLEKTYEDRCVSLLWLKVDPVYDSLRSDPRFSALLKRAGMANGWQMGSAS